MTSHKPSEPSPSDFGGGTGDQAGQTAAGAGVPVAPDTAEQSEREIDREESAAHPS